jgi:tripartite-type tricarboxylate transporter receptor subunit TctC
MLVPETGDRASQARDREEIVRKIQVLMTAVAALASLAAAPPARADDFPTRPIHVVIAFPAGGPTDFVGRVISEKMKAVLGQSVIIDNKPGANGTLGGEFVAKSDPDGYTLFLTTAGAVTVSPHIMADIHYDALRDFAPVALVTKVTEIIVVTPKAGIKTVKELVALAKEKPGTISFASTGIGSPPHLTQELLSASANVKFLHVPYRGAAPALTDLLGGQVQALTADVPVLIAQIQAGNLVPIGAAADKRDAILPDVPTLAEQGYPNTDASNWYGLLAPAKTPPDIIAKINKAVNEALNDPEIRTKLVQAGATPVGGTPESFGTFMKAEYEKWGRVVKERGIKDTQ